MNETCTLCRLPLPLTDSYLFRDDRNLFCCRGCQTVYSILDAQSALDNYSEHPVFLQAVRTGLISDPNFSTEKKEEESIPEDDFKKMHLIIDEMWCPSCARLIHLVLMKEKGVRNCAVDYSTDLASIEYTPRFISVEKILTLIRGMAYVPRSMEDPRDAAVSRSLMLRFIVAAFFSLNIMMFAYPIYAAYLNPESDGYVDLFARLSLLGSIPVLCYSGWPIWRRFYHGLKVGIWGMEALVCIGVFSATALSLYELSRGSAFVYFDSMTVIVVFVLLGKIIESRAKFSAKDALVKLSLALPKRGRKRFSDGKESFVPVRDIEPGDLFVIYAGEKIVLDGVVEEGEGACDESLMTGEAKLIPKSTGSDVLAGSILARGYVAVRATAGLEETNLHRIMEMVGREIEHKSVYVRAVDKIVTRFVPFVLCLALLTGIYCLVFEVADGAQTVFQTAMIRIVSVLLISCPCAIGIAAPLVEAYVLNALAKIGVIVRNRGCLTFLGRESVFAFDKTGTVTEGRFEVCAGFDELSLEEKMILKGLVIRSIHPIASAINRSLDVSPGFFEKVEEKIGKGICGMLEGDCYLLGSEAFLREEKVVLPNFSPVDKESILTRVYFAKNGTCLSELILGDRLREDVRDFIRSLSPLRTMLLSGDGSGVTRNVAQACGILGWYSECRPEGKKIIIDGLKAEGHIVAMLGDGINDAPALAASHVGIAVFSASDVSVQVSDILLTTSRFKVLSAMRRIAVLGHRIVKQNLFWAFFYNFVGLGLAASGMLSPLFAAFAMVISSMIVLGNTQRVAFLANRLE